MDLRSVNNIGKIETYKNPLIDKILEEDLGKGTVVYSPVYGELCYNGKEGGKLNFLRMYNKEKVQFRLDGSLADNADCMLFPSKDALFVDAWKCVPRKLS